MAHTGMHIGKKIKMLRALKGFTQDELAKKINKTRALVSHIEQTGKANFYTLQSISAVLNMSVEEVEEFSGDQILKEPAQHTYNSNKVSSLQQKLDNCLKEIKTLRELVNSQKKLIAVLEKKK